MYTVIKWLLGGYQTVNKYMTDPTLSYSNIESGATISILLCYLKTVDILLIQVSNYLLSWY